MCPLVLTPVAHIGLTTYTRLLPAASKLLRQRWPERWAGKDRESRYVPIIDFGERKHTAFLPYGLLVMDDAVVMLHGRFRIALSFPDLTMGTFSKIMATPGDIKKLMQALAE